MISVTLIFRKKNPVFFSIERVFEKIEKELSKEVGVQKFIAPKKGISWDNIKAIRNRIKKDKTEIYHITGDIHYAALALPGRRTLLTIHDCVFLYQQSGWKRLVLKKLLLDWPVRRCALVTTISEASKQDILKYTGCRPEKVVVIPNPITGLIQYRASTFRQTEPVILFIGSTPNKNLLRVIAALENISCRLHIIGEISPAVKELLVQHAVSYRQESRLSDEELAERYSSADLVLFPSTFEGFGLPILEAQMTGRPVITSNISPMKEVAGKGACLVDPYSVGSIREGVLRVLQDAGYREELVKEGLQNTKRFDVSAIAGQYIECYKKLNV